MNPRLIRTTKSKLSGNTGNTLKETKKNDCLRKTIDAYTKEVEIIGSVQLECIRKMSTAEVEQKEQCEDV